MAMQPSDPQAGGQFGPPPASYQPPRPQFQGPSGHHHDGDPPGRIVVDNLSKTFGSVRAVNNLSFTVEPGSVTGFLGPNGAGKTTTLRMLLGLVTPTSGRATIGGQLYGQIHNPMTVVGAALEAASFHPGRTARNHLLVYTAATGLPDSRVDEVIDLVGLAEARRRKVRGYSLGMRQRLALAATLLGDPRVLILDEPANGLDPAGIRWLREFFRRLADEGRTVLVSSHQLSEIEAVADRVVILDRGNLVRSGSIEELTAGTDSIVVRGPEIDRLADAATRAGKEIAREQNGTLRIRSGDTAEIGHLAFTNNIELHELTLQKFDLEQLFFALTQGDQGGPPPGPPGGPPQGPPPGPAQGPPPGYAQPPHGGPR